MVVMLNLPHRLVCRRTRRMRWKGPEVLGRQVEVPGSCIVLEGQSSHSRMCCSAGLKEDCTDEMWFASVRSRCLVIVGGGHEVESGLVTETRLRTIAGV